MRSILVLLGILSLAACDANSHTLYVDARQAFARHDYKVARLHLIEALKVDPGNRDVLLLQARTLVELGDGEGAAASIQRLTDGKSPQGELAELAASAALLRRNPAVVFDLLGSAHNAEAERLKATAALQQKDLEKAIAHLDQAIAAGGNARTYADFARVWLIRGDLARADAMAREAQRRGPDDFSTLLISGELASRKGDLASALGFYDKADHLFPGNIAVLSGKAGVLGDLGRFDALERTLSQLVELAPRDPDVTYLRVRLAQARKNWKGIKALVQPLEAGLERQNPIRLVYAEALLNLGEAEQAIAQSIGIARSQPDNRKAAMILATAQFAAGDARGARERWGRLPTAPRPAVRSWR